MRRVLPLLLALAGCATAPRVAAPPAPVTPPLPVGGLERVMGRTPVQLTALLGEPAQDLRERTGRRLQWAGPVCVLDAYLYPPAGGGDAVVTYLDARLPDGADIDRASCVAALIRARGR